MHPETDNTIIPLDTIALFYWSISQNLEQPSVLLLVDHANSLSRRFAIECGLSIMSVNTRCECSSIDDSAEESPYEQCSLETAQLTQFDLCLGNLEENIVPQRNVLSGFYQKSVIPFPYKVVTIDSHFNSLRNLKWIHVHDPYNIEMILSGANSALAKTSPIVTFEIAESESSTDNIFLSVQQLLRDMDYVIYDTDFQLACVKPGTGDKAQNTYMAIKDTANHNSLIDGCRASVTPYKASSKLDSSNSC